MSFPTKQLETVIFASRWIQAPLYIGLIVAQVVYCYLFMIELSHLVMSAFSTTHVSEADVMLVVLGLIDVVMIANLLVMVIVGGYETFVSRLDLENHPGGVDQARPNPRLPTARGLERLGRYRGLPATVGAPASDR